MSTMTKDAKDRRVRRVFTEEFKAGAVRLVLEEGKTVGQVSRDLDLTEPALREWVHRARADRTQGRTGLTTAEREELARLRKENRILAEEREILQRSRLGRCAGPACLTGSWRRNSERSGAAASWPFDSSRTSGSP